MQKRELLCEEANPESGTEIAGAFQPLKSANSSAYKSVFSGVFELVAIGVKRVNDFRAQVLRITGYPTRNRLHR